MSIAEHLSKSLTKHKEKSKKEPESSHRPGHASGVHIEKADNGYTVKSHEKNSEVGPYKAPEKTVFGHKDHKKMMKHISECLGCDGEEPKENE